MAATLGALLTGLGVAAPEALTLGVAAPGVETLGVVAPGVATLGVAAGVATFDAWAVGAFDAAGGVAGFDAASTAEAISSGGGNSASGGMARGVATPEAGIGVRVAEAGRLGC